MPAHDTTIQPFTVSLPDAHLTNLRPRPMRSLPGEEAGEQLGDAAGLVVMDPVRGVGRALDADQIGDVVGVEVATT